MANPYAQFKTSTNHETQGVWLEEPMFRVRVRRAGGSNTAYTQRGEKAFRPYRRAIANNSLDAKLMDRILREIYVDSVIVGWSVRDTVDGDWQDNKMHGIDGAVVEYNRENAMAVLEAVPELWSAIRDQSSNITLFSGEEVVDDAKN